MLAHRTKHIVNRAVVILLMIVIGIPCSLKRDIKQVLHLPVTDIPISAKANNIFVCQTETNKTFQKVSFAQQKLAPLQCGDNFLLFIGVSMDVFQYQKSFGADFVFSIVPIYKLHEQYLI